MQHQTLAFDPYDVLLIHNGIAARNARISAATALHNSVSRRCDFFIPGRAGIGHVAL
jgi:hypothetical protein